MPYIPQKDREVTKWPMTAGDLNYQITKLIDRHITLRGLRYTVINEAIGVLECAKLELYRRIATPYEDVKLVENGDVYSEGNTGVRKEAATGSPPKECSCS